MAETPRPGVASGLHTRDPRTEYEVGWICNQSDSFEAARKMLDSHSSPLHVKHGDHTSYALGTIGERKVVIGFVNQETPNKTPNSMPSFENLKTLLFVGTGGGIPNLSEQIDVRLGDVVTNLRQDKIQTFYLYEGELQSRTLVAPTSSRLRTAISSIMSGNQIQMHIAKALSDMNKEFYSKNGYPKDDHYPSRPSATDRLYKREYPHVGSLMSQANNESLIADPCLNCEEYQQVYRPSRETPHPLIHDGAIAVIDRGLEDVLGPLLGDSFAKHGVLSLMPIKELPSPHFMVCGISDYADSHKNEIWRPYAATVAALVAREIILAMPIEI